jgi:hypothetical protein
VPALAGAARSSPFQGRSQRVRGARRRGFVLIAQLLLSQVPKFIFLAFGLAGFLPKLIRSRFNFFFGRFGHCISPIGARPYVQVSGAAEGGADHATATPCRSLAAVATDMLQRSSAGAVSDDAAAFRPPLNVHGRNDPPGRCVGSVGERKRPRRDPGYNTPKKPGRGRSLSLAAVADSIPEHSWGFGVHDVRHQAGRLCAVYGGGQGLRRLIALGPFPIMRCGLTKMS